MTSLDDPSRIGTLRDLVNNKTSLRRIYLEVYSKYARCLEKCPANGKILELGTGAGFAKEMIPGLITSDKICYNGIDMVVDATELPFGDRSLSAIFMMNVFHHIQDVSAFFNEARRCLLPGGRVLMMEPHPGWISGPVYKYIHHEPMDEKAGEWKFETTGPLSDANTALPWIVFQRDLHLFESRFSDLKLVRYERHTPLRYWLSGGLRKWSLLPGSLFGIATLVDRMLVRFSGEFGSFVDIELLRE